MAYIGILTKCFKKRIFVMAYKIEVNLNFVKNAKCFSRGGKLAGALIEYYVIRKRLLSSCKINIFFL